MHFKVGMWFLGRFMLVFLGLEGSHIFQLSGFDCMPPSICVMPTLRPPIYGP